ncbi:MAG: HNH endonuclease signature motif containing protein [Microbacterium sp.]|uniref:HNH endonuclease signature motif containing protein n=1 Tax=Microbacterium sp. TaxID=51671 RepID=UPI002619E8ED|nr:HNH endonuclease signature motif containing protein [Microbacterium sp.]MCX6501741.1 HNH endonuclease signature motif containing protein [Microbacterium sp.]
MREQVFTNLSDAGINRLAEIVQGVQSLDVVAAATDAKRRRLLADAFQLAETETVGQPGRVKARDMALRAIASEIAAASRLSDRSVQRQIGDAAQIVSGFPATLAAYEQGTITRAHVHLISDLGTPLPPAAREEFDRRAAARAEDESASRLRDELALLAERLHPRTLTERHAEAREQRSLRAYALSDGMSGLTVIGPTLLIEAIVDRTHQQARALADARAQAKARTKAANAGASFGIAAASSVAEGVAAGSDEGASVEDALLASDGRTIPQMQFDIFADMLLTSAVTADPTRTDDGPGTLGAIRATVQVVVAATTLLGADDAPVDLVGRSPIDADTARRLADSTAAAGRHWIRVITDPITGTVLHSDARLACASQRLFIKARDRHCRWPGCRLPAIRCDVDHTVDHHLGGPTHIDNEASLCDRHHTMKQFTPWRVRQLGGGILEWTSPLGRIYIDTPPVPTVHFVPARNGADDRAPF